MRSDELPFNHPWNQGPLRNYAQVIVGGTPSTEIGAFWGGAVPWMASGEVHLRNVHDVPGRITEKGLSSSNAVIVQPKAVAIALAGQGKTRGTVALTHIPLCTNQSVALIKADPQQLDPDFLFQALIPRYEELRSRSAGGGRAGLSKGILEGLPVQVPPLFVQKRIAEILWTVDNAIEHTEALIAKTQQIKAGLMYDLFTRGITADGQLRPGREEAPYLYKESPLGWIPKEWNRAPLPTVASYQHGRPFPSTEYSDEGVLLLRPGNLNVNGLVEFDPAHTTWLPSKWLKEASAFVINQGDILMNLTAQSLEDGFLGRVCLNRQRETALLNQRIARFSSIAKEPLFLYWLLRSRQFRTQIEKTTQGTKVQHLYNRDLDRVVFWIPAAEGERAAIADKLAAVTDTIFSEKAALVKLHHQKHGLMQDLLTGHVVVAVPSDATVAEIATNV